MKYRDTITATTTIRFTWRERFRILFGYGLLVRTETNTQHVIGVNRTVSFLLFQRPAWTRRFERKTTNQEARPKL